MNIKKRVLVKYKLTVLTGLHIGGNKETYGIGGIDSPVIKNPLTNEPIIPGSSIKGKMRMLITYITDNGDDKNLTTNKAFGAINNNLSSKTLMTRIIFRDLFLTDDSKKILQNKLGKGFYTEVKAENKIDNIKISANPRFIERVPAGAEFEGECVVNILENDTEDFVKILEDGFKLLENNFLGGSGSRGYGKVAIEIVSKEELE